MDIGIFVFHGKGCKTLEWTSQGGGGVTIRDSAQQCVDVDDGECGGGAGFTFGFGDLKGLFEL